MKFVLQKGGYYVIRSYRFRAGFKVNTKSVICPVDSVAYGGYTISYNLLKYIFCEKYPAKDFNEFYGVKVELKEFYQRNKKEGII